MKEEIKIGAPFKEHSTVEIYIEGMTNQADGTGQVLLEFYEGKWMLFTWADANSADPTHRVDLSNAKEISK